MDVDYEDGEVKLPAKKMNPHKEAAL